MQSNGKIYSSPAEQSFRMGIFSERLNEVIAHNSKPGVTWQMGLNKFSDMSYEELATKYLGEVAESSEDFLRDTEYVSDPNFAAPVSVDWRKYVPKVLNQGSCGSCWAFATAGTAEAQYNKAKGKSDTFSPQQVLDCYPEAGSCNGGTHINGSKFYLQSGAALLANYPYKAVPSSCKNSEAGTLTIKASNRVAFEDGSYSQWLEAVAKGPVSMTIKVNNSLFGYKSGDYDISDCVSSGLHAVSIVGYDETAWIVRNSWGGDWGSQGYFRVAKKTSGSGVCNMYWRCSYVTF